MWNQVLVSTGGTCEAGSTLAACGLRTGGECRELLGVELLDHPEAAELALVAVEVAVVVRVTGHEAIAADVIERRHALDDVDGERQPRDPRSPRALSSR